MFKAPLLERIARECYSDPGELYATLKARGMDLITVTDHDSIDGSEPLRRYPDFFLSEEVTCTMPGGAQIHTGVYGITEKQHIEIQRRRDDLVSLLIYLTEHQILFSINHVISSLTGRRDAEDFRWFHSYFPAYETRNGQMTPRQNALAAQLAAAQGKAPIAGSDAHTLASAGTTFTEIPGARDAQEFLSGLRAGQGIARGEHGSYFKLTRDVFLIIAGMMREIRWTTALAPFATIVPLVTLTHMASEVAFARRWNARLSNSPEARNRPLWELEMAAEEVLS